MTVMMLLLPTIRQMPAPEFHGSQLFNELFEAPQEFLRPQPRTINFLLPLPLFPFPHCRVERESTEICQPLFF
jgi:hypothetical protein